jgi:hypothetical protein
MTRYLAGVLTVIAAGVLLVAYGLFNPPAAMDGSIAMAPLARPNGLAQTASMQIVPPADAGSAAYGAPVVYAYTPAGYVQAPAAYTPPTPVATPVAVAAPQPRTSASAFPQAPRRSARRVESEPKNDWKKTAMIVGGSSAAGAGLGAIFGGKKGALIGAAIGGGASTIYEVTK